MVMEDGIRVVPVTDGVVPVGWEIEAPGHGILAAVIAEGDGDELDRLAKKIQKVRDFVAAWRRTWDEWEAK